MFSARRPDAVAMLLLLAGGALFGWGRAHQTQVLPVQTALVTAPMPAAAQLALAGPFRGWMADADLLAAFSVYYLISHPEPGQAAARPRLVQHLAALLDAASRLDPRFKDVYRVTGGVLSFQPGQAARAITIMERGAMAGEDWETPLVAGFLAHELLGDDARAVRLLKLAATKPGAPPMALGVAARIIAKRHSVEDSVRFLEGMKRSLPKEYHGAIDARIARLRANAMEGAPKEDAL
ncbi:MAG: hypothetical protein R8K47_06235, partial [Mariprofundaceae bacterium]